MTPTWLSLLPPFIVIIAVLITKRLNISLGLGIISAAFIASQGNLSTAGLSILQRISEHIRDLDNLYIYIFLIAISSIITLLTYTGNASAAAQIISQKVKTKKAAETSSLFLSLLLSIDDYLSILTVGYVTRPLASQLAIARVKIAFLVHALAGPVVILVPISSWAAAILAQLDQAGITLDRQPHTTITADPFFAYLNTIPFMFYSLLIITSVFFIVRMNISFGPLHDYEKQTEPQKADFIPEPKNQTHSLIALLLPLLLLPIGVIIGILISGNYHLFGGNASLLEAFKNNNQTFLVMCLVGICTFIISCAYSLIYKQIFLSNLPTIIGSGIRLMYNAILMVILATILGVFLRENLMTGNYIASLLLNAIPIALLPVMIFITSLIITLSTGSAWGTFALMIPIVIQMLISLFQLTPPITPQALPILFPALGAILSGAVCGDHISPFSETTIMTATSTGIKPLEHFYTQFPYALPAIIGTIFAFLLSGLLSTYSFWFTVVFSFGAGLILCLIMLYSLNKKK